MSHYELIIIPSRSLLNNLLIYSKIKLSKANHIEYISLVPGKPVGKMKSLTLSGNHHSSLFEDFESPIPSGFDFMISTCVLNLKVSSKMYLYANEI